MKSLHLLVSFLALCFCSASASPPNILFAIADDWGVHAGTYGTKWVKTPNVDRVARDGIRFENAYTPNAKCTPSRSCILTGRNSWQLKAAANHWCEFPLEFKSWGEVLVEKGWQVGQTCKGWAPGISKNADGSNRPLIGQTYNRRKAVPATTGISDIDYAANFDDFLDAAPKGKPWAFWYGAVEPHRGYEFGSGLKKGTHQLGDIDRVPAFWPDNETVRTDLLDYGFEIEHFDRHLGRMLASLEKRGLLDNTLVIVTSDHGMPFPRGKGGAYEYSNHVPFVAMWKGGIVGGGRSVEDFVSFIDLAPTIIELAGLEWSEAGMPPSPGRSLTPIFKSEKSGIVDPSRDHVLIGMERHDVGRPDDVGYPIRGIVTRDYLYLKNYEPDRWPACNPETGYLNVDGGATKTFILEARRRDSADVFWKLCFGKRPAEEFYDLKTDPDCVKNLASDPALAAKRESLAQKMTAELKQQQDPRMDGHGEIFDRYPYADPKSAHFHERYLKGEKLNHGWVSPGDFEKGPIGD